MTNPLPIQNLVFESRDEFSAWLSERETAVVVKLSAGWCSPCQRIKPRVHHWHSLSNANLQFVFVDVDEVFDLYAYLRSRKVAPAIPCILYYRAENSNAIAPDKVLLGANEQSLDNFFMSVLQEQM